MDQDQEEIKFDYDADNLMNSIFGSLGPRLSEPIFIFRETQKRTEKHPYPSIE